MSSDPILDRTIAERLKTKFGLKDRGKWLRGGKCPDCDRKELFVAADSPRVVMCGRKDNCGYEAHVKDLFEDLFTDWSKRFPKTVESPTASADAYLLHERGFDLKDLRGHYSQEHYHDQKRDVGSATVRFPLPGGCWWERIIDQTKRFDRKANFAFGKEYDGQWWMYPGTYFDQLAQASEIWIDEGIFDSIALEQGRFRRDRESADDDALKAAPVRHAVSIMSCYNYPEKALAQLRAAVLRGPTPFKFPRIVFALDLGGAGTKYTREHVIQAREEGWPDVTAAQVRLDDDLGAKLDWNDLFLRRDRMTPAHIQDYLWHGEVLIAPSAEEKAFLIWKRKRFSSFNFTFRNRTYWAYFSKEQIAERISEGFKDEPELSVADIETKTIAAARKVGSIIEIANCAFRALYKQRDEITDETYYWFRVDFPTDRASAKGHFAPSAVSSAQEFAKRLVAIGTGAYWTGETEKLVKILQRQMTRIKDVEPIPFTGYSRAHGAWLLGDIAVRDGKLVAVNDNGFFDFGKQSVKLSTRERILPHIEPDTQKPDFSWLEDFWLSYRENGLITLAFWVGSLFAEHIRAEQSSFPFLELIGPPGTAKTAIIMFLWKLLGRLDHEGMDTNKATQAGLSRELAKVAGIPFVFMESRRDNAAQQRPSNFDWDELLTAYNGRPLRTRGMATGGLETYAPLFRSSILIEQNVPVEASPALLERILHLDFNKDGWNDQTKEAARRLDRIEVGKVSHFIVYATLKEQKFLETYRAAYGRHEVALRAMPGITNGRLEHNHAQLLALLDALATILPIGPERVAQATAHIHMMAVTRHRALETEHPVVSQFWERVEAILDTAGSASSVNAINHSRNFLKGEYAIRLAEYEQIASARWKEQPNGADLRRHLKTSKNPRFVDQRTVNSIHEKTLHCWVFQREGVGAAA